MTTLRQFELAGELVAALREIKPEGRYTYKVRLEILPEGVAFAMVRAGEAFIMDSLIDMGLTNDSD